MAFSGRYSCLYCKKSFVKRDILCEHYYAAHNAYHLCPYCSSQFCTANVKDEHIRTCHGSSCENARFQCPFCDMVYLSVDDCSQHLGSIHNERIRELFCDVCKVVFPTRGSFRAHHRYRHPELLTRDLVDQSNSGPLVYTISDSEGESEPEGALRTEAYVLESKIENAPLKESMSSSIRSTKQEMGLSIEDEKIPRVAATRSVEADHAALEVVNLNVEMENTLTNSSGDFNELTGASTKSVSEAVPSNVISITLQKKKRKQTLSEPMVCVLCLKKYKAIYTHLRTMHANEVRLSGSEWKNYCIPVGLNNAGNLKMERNTEEVARSNSRGPEDVEGNSIRSMAPGPCSMAADEIIIAELRMDVEQQKRAKELCYLTSKETNGEMRGEQADVLAAEGTGHKSKEFFEEIQIAFGDSNLEKSIPMNNNNNYGASDESCHTVVESVIDEMYKHQRLKKEFPVITKIRQEGHGTQPSSDCYDGSMNAKFLHFQHDVIETLERQHEVTMAWVRGQFVKFGEGLKMPKEASD